jgi:signal transduction histidine kinase
MHYVFILVNVIAPAVLTFLLLRKNIRVPLWLLCVIYAAVFTAYVAVFAATQHGNPSVFSVYLKVQQYEMIASFVCFAWLPFILIRKSLWQNALIYAVRGPVLVAGHGIANYAELRLGGSYADRHPYLIATVASLVVIALMYPVIYVFLKKILALWPEKNNAYTRTMWVIPAAVVFLSLSNQSIFDGEHVYDDLFVLILRLILLVAILVVMWITFQALQNIRDKERLAARMKIADIQIDNQRKQYEAMASDIDYMNRLRHDMRHQRVAIMGYLDRDDVSGAKAYINDVVNAPENAEIKLYCHHYAVNSIVNHYAQRLTDSGVKTQFKLDIPHTCGRIQDSDLCVIAGNLLENAFEACERVQSTSRSVDVRAQVQGDRLLFTVKNTYNGAYVRRGDLYMSLKERQPTDENTGIGLASVRSVCEQYDGELRISMDGHMWSSACVLVM